jgi:tetratricopeptide (TPR) repeat protein
MGDGVLYLPGHEITENYGAGMTALYEGRLQEAVSILLSERSGSPCRTMALGNAVLALRRLDRFEEAAHWSGVLFGLLPTLGCPHPPSEVQFLRVYGEILRHEEHVGSAIEMFQKAVHHADWLAEEYPGHTEDIELQKAHALNSWGAALLVYRNWKGAMDAFRAARDIYERHPENLVGRAEALTNFAHAARMNGDLTTAEIALREAMSVVELTRDLDQEARILSALIQLDSTIVPVEEAFDKLEEGAVGAEAEQRYSTALLRWAVLAEHAFEKGEHSVALKAVMRARRLEGHLDTQDMNLARVRGLEASVRRAAGHDPTAVVEGLLDGARMWFGRVWEEGHSETFQRLVHDMHDQFRLLSRCLLDLGRVEEALVAFEAGRALRHAVEVDRSFAERARAMNPFRERNTCDTGLLEGLQQGLAEDDALLVIAVIPDQIVAFLVTDQFVRHCAVDLPADIDARSAFFNEVSLIPTRLQERVGLRAIPVLLKTLGNIIAGELGDRRVLGIAPYAVLHDVPWRVLLRESGVPWSQLASSINFGLFISRPYQGEVCLDSCVALGNGAAGTIDLVQEARDFSAEFGERGALVENCRAIDVESAFRGPGVVMLSCHGAVAQFGHEMALYLQFADGSAPLQELVPSTISTDLVILSACESGVYYVLWGEYPVGAAPVLLRMGVRYVLGSRYRIGASFAASFFPALARELAEGVTPLEAFACVSEAHDTDSVARWKDLACVELLGG